MSDYIHHHFCNCAFNTSDSWVILSPIEQSIKNKIERIGTPLKDWNIQINYGVKTGFNEAFIITTEKRNEILSNCRTEEERKKTDELIRPILRGRDIKRYSYDWANLWLIATFPSRHYDIEKYLSIKEHLLSFGIERLEQTGKEHTINGQKVKARKKTANKWFETQDSISYWDDFNKPKIIWPCIMASEPCFVYDDKNFMTPAPGNIISGENLKLLLVFLCSKIMYFALRKFYMGGGIEGELKTNRLELLPIPLPNYVLSKLNEKKIPLEQFLNENNTDLEEIICNIIGLNENEMAVIFQTCFGGKNEK